MSGYPDTASLMADMPAAETPAPTPQASDAPVEAAAPTPQPQGFKWELTEGDNKFVVTDENLAKKWAQQGRNYAQRMEQLKKQQSEFEAKYKGYDRFQTVDEYAKQNPDWWKYVEEQYANRSQFNPTGDPNIQQAIQRALEEKLAPVQEFMSQQQQLKRDEELRQADSALRDQIESIQKQFPDLDFNHVDETGKSLEQQVLDHAMSNGIHSFTAAFRDFYWEKHSARQLALGKEQAAKEVQKQRQNGILSTAKVQPGTVGNGHIPYNRNKSYDELVNEEVALMMNQRN